MVLQETCQPPGSTAPPSTANASALVDLTSTTKGFLPPRMTQAQRDAIATPTAEWLQIYQTDNTPGLYQYSAGAWTQVGGAALAGTPTAPTASAGTNTTQLATTAFVTTAVAGKESALTFSTPLSRTTDTVSLGTVPVANGGTGLSTLTSGSYLVGNGTSSTTLKTPAQVTADLSAMVGDTGSGGTKGLVPAPATGDAAANKFLKANGTWATAGSTLPMTTLGDVIYGATAGAPTRLAGHTVYERRFLTQVGTGTGSAAPSWSAFSAADLAVAFDPTTSSGKALVSNGSNWVAGNATIGSDAFQNTKGGTMSFAAYASVGGNTAFGYASAYRLRYNADFNTAIGYNALGTTLDAADDNTAVGAVS